MAVSQEEQEWVRARNFLSGYLDESRGSYEDEEACEYCIIGYVFKYNIDIQLKEVMSMICERNYRGAGSVVLERPQRSRKSSGGASAAASASGWLGMGSNSPKQFLRADGQRRARALDMLSSIDDSVGNYLLEDEGLKNEMIIYGIAAVFLKKSDLGQWKEGSRIGDRSLRITTMELLSSSTDWQASSW